MERAITESKLGSNSESSDVASFWRSRAIDYRRHIQDLRTRSYEGSVSRQDREQTFRGAFDLVTPVAHAVLAALSETFLAGSGRIRAVPPKPANDGGLLGFWEMTWHLQQKARNRFTQENVPPLAIYTVFPLQPTLGMEWTHPHFAMLRPCCHDGLAAAWPMQVTCDEDAWRQEPILRVLAEAELHEMTFLADLNWRLLPSLYEAE
jgi:hypothetical protein